MALTPGTRLGAYEVISAIGAGGMGEVYKAQDSKLGRQVAIKVLPASVAGDPERVARFEREARALAALNHPNIATLFGLDDVDHAAHKLLLVMELVEGETLADRLRRGPIRVEPALAIARQIAEALEAAHEKGIVHRDLKPANVKITPDDHVKVLDFGLAKAMEPMSGTSPGAPDAAVFAKSTMTSPALTEMGVILGTAAYMSPEQARGLAADHRSDIFSFGVVLYEMLTGRQAFPGDTVTDVLASVLARDPDLHALPAGINARLIDLVRRCLDKSPKKRWQAIGDVRMEIEFIAAAPRVAPMAASNTPARALPVPWGRRVLPYAGVALLSIGVTAAVMSTTMPRPTPPIITRFSIPIEDAFRGTSRPMLAVSPDGTSIAYLAGQPAGIYVRAMGETTARLVAGSVDPTSAIGLMFSPDGRSIGYWSASGEQSIKRIPVEGGAPGMICKTETPNGMTWTDAGILFANTDGIHRVPATGGTPTTLIKVSFEETAFGPQLLPDGHTVLYTVAPTGGGGDKWDRATVVAQSIGSTERKTILTNASAAFYVSTGHLIFAREGIIYAIAFDPAKLATTGPEASVLEGVRRGSGTIGPASANISLADNGTLIYIAGPIARAAAQLQLGLFDLHGALELLEAGSGAFQFPRMSPDGTYVAFTVDDGKAPDVWVYDMRSRHSRRLTFGGRNRAPAWSSDSRHVLFQSDREGDLGIYWQRADGAGAAERLTTAAKDAEQQPLSWQPGGDVFLFDETTKGRTSLHAFSMRDRKAVPMPRIESTQLTGAVFSPDGKWISYTARVPGESNAVYVEPYPQTGAKYQISRSTEDAHHQVWSPAGDAIFYTPGVGTRLIRVPVVTTPSFSNSPATVLERPFQNTAGSSARPYDIAHDGKHIVGLAEMVASGQPGRAAEVNVILNWLQIVQEKAPAGR